jgi:hypothetical protein
MAKFYFTYGTDEEFPFRGGWSEVEADNLSMAVEIFNLMHPKRKSGCVNCAFWYTEEQFKASGMLNGNLGHCCHERISVTREFLTP